MRVLLDTCVLSELRKDNCNKNVRRVFEEIADKELFISVITVGEITKGISLLNESRRKRDLNSWLKTLEHHYADRILSIDLETARIWGELTSLAQRSGFTVASSDGLIAATAICHGLHLFTRNVSNFKPTGALLINPWTE